MALLENNVTTIGACGLNGGNRRYELFLGGPVRGALTERMGGGNGGLVAVKQLTNLQQLERLLK